MQSAKVGRASTSEFLHTALGIRRKLDCMLGFHTALLVSQSVAHLTSRISNRLAGPASWHNTYMHDATARDRYCSPGLTILDQSRLSVANGHASLDSPVSSIDAATCPLEHIA